MSVIPKLAMIAALVVAFAFNADAQSKPREPRQSKPVSSESILRSLLTLREKARDAGLELTVETLTEAILKLARQWESTSPPAYVAECDTDLDCEKKNPHVKP